MKGMHSVTTWAGLVSCVLLMTVHHAAHAATTGKTIPPGSTLPAFTIEMPDDPKIQEYIGIKDAKEFSLSQIQAKLVIVEFFSVFCPVCQKQAPIANKVYRVISESPELSKDVKMIGIGLSNKPFEIGVYKKNFDVPFPLFQDPKKSIQESSGVESIPLTLLVDKNGKVLTSHLGVIEDLDGFLSEVREFHKRQGL